MRQALPMRIEGDFEILNAELWWMDLERVTFWAERRIDVSHAPRARVQLGDRRDYVDIVCQLQEQYDHRLTRVRTGCVYSANYQVMDQANLAFLHARLCAINPAVAKAIQLQELNSESLEVETAPIGDRTNTAAASALVEPKASSSETPIQAPPKGIPGLTTMLSRSPTPSLFLHFQTKEALAKCFALREPAVLRIPATMPLERNEKILVALQLPTGVFVQQTGRVQDCTSTEAVIELVQLTVRERAQISQLMGST